MIRDFFSKRTFYCNWKPGNIMIEKCFDFACCFTFYYSIHSLPAYRFYSGWARLHHRRHLTVDFWRFTFNVEFPVKLWMTNADVYNFKHGYWIEKNQMANAKG